MSGRRTSLLAARISGVLRPFRRVPGLIPVTGAWPSTTQRGWVRDLERPLGVRADAPLTAAHLRRLAILHRYDLSPVRARLLRTELLTPTLADLMIFEFRRYLGLRLVLGRSVPMLSRAVDEVWHTTLLFTRLYADLCEQVFGRFLHHDPATEPWSDLDARWGDFSASYYRLYGPLGSLWENARRSQ